MNNRTLWEVEFVPEDGSAGKYFQRWSVTFNMILSTRLITYNSSFIAEKSLNSLPSTVKHFTCS